MVDSRSSPFLKTFLCSIYINLVYNVSQDIHLFVHSLISPQDFIEPSYVPISMLDPEGHKSR